MSSIIWFGSALFALAIVTPAFSSAAESDDPPGPVLRVPGFPPVQLPRANPGFEPLHPPPGDNSADGLDRPNSDLYHEFGTVTPGGGAKSRNRVQPDYGGLVIGPGGIVKPTPRPTAPPVPDHRAPAAKHAQQPNPRPAAPPKPKQLTPEEKQAQIRKALRPPPPLAVARRKTLDDLYTKLAAAKDENEAKGLASLISAVWMRSGSDTADLLMARAETAIASKNLPLALSVLDKLVELKPKWAEAWNKRATVRYLSGDLNGSMADVDRTLKLEPNQFSALSGLAMILQQTGFDKRALQVYRRVLSIYPHQPEIERMVDKLTLQVEGQGI